MFVDSFTPKLWSTLKFYNGQIFISDLLAGLTVAIVALPLSMALAVASGVSPEKGLITAIFAGFFISTLGGSRVQIGGPTGAFVVVILDVVLRHGYDGLILATLCAGLILIIAGYARLGLAIKFLPHSVITGFTAGIAVIIFTTQVKDFLGLQFQEARLSIFSSWVAYIRHLGSLNTETVGIGLGSLFFILLLQRLAPKWPGYLTILILSSFLVQFFGIPVETIGDRFPNVSSALPFPTLPVFSLEKVHTILPSALIIAFLAGVESLLSAMVADGMTGYRHRPNQELIGQGFANIVSACMGGLPATGALARTATNIKAGGKTPMAGVAHAFFLLCFMLFALDTIKYVPLATLAAILFVVAWGMSEIHHFVHLLRVSREDRLIIIVTFLLTVFVDLTVGISVGVGLSSLLFIQQMSQSLIISKGGGQLESEEIPIQRSELPKDVEVLTISGPIFYGVVSDFIDTIRNLSQTPKVLILNMNQVPYMDTTGLRALKNLVLMGENYKSAVIFCGLQMQPMELLRQDLKIGKKVKLTFVGTFSEALDLAKEMVREST